MKIGLHIGTNSKLPHIREGFEKLGFKCKLIKSSSENLSEYDFVVVWSMKSTLGAKCLEIGKPLLVMEHGYIGDRTTNIAIGWNEINGHADFCYGNMDGSRAKKLKPYMKPWKKTGNKILLLGQTTGDHTLKDMDYRLESFYPDMAKKLMKAYDMPVEFRSHPLWKCKTPPWLELSEGKSLEEDLEDAWLAVAWSSNSLVDAVLSGTPILACNNMSMAYDLGIHEVGETPTTPDRTNWLNQIANSQWTIEEIRQGKFWDNLKRGL